MVPLGKQWCRRALIHRRQRDARGVLRQALEAAGGRVQSSNQRGEGYVTESMSEPEGTLWKPGCG